MGSNFMQQFMAGWQMGQGRNENQRRNQELEMERARQQQMLQQRAEEFELQKEEFAVRRKQLAAEEATHKLTAAQEARKLREEANYLQGMAPPTAAEAGIQQTTPQDVGPTMDQINVPQPTQAIPDPTGGADIQMPVLTGRQQQEMELAEKQKKMREVLGLFEAQKGIEAQYREKPKGLQEIEAEAAARARGTASVKPPPAPTEPGEMGTRQRSAYMTITNKFQSDKIMEKAGNAAQADQLADMAIADPSKATNQLATLYLLVKNLDPDSAVREGELGLAQATQSYWQKFQNNWARVTSGQIIAPEAAKELALATKALSKQWAERGSKRIQQYKAQASGAGIGEQFGQYLTEAGMGAPGGGGGSPQATHRWSPRGGITKIGGK